MMHRTIRQPFLKVFAIVSSKNDFKNEPVGFWFKSYNIWNDYCLWRDSEIVKKMIICGPVMTVKKNMNSSFSDSSVLCSWDLCTEQLEFQMSPLVFTENINMDLRSEERVFYQCGLCKFNCVSWEAVPGLQWVENVSLPF